MFIHDSSLSSKNFSHQFFDPVFRNYKLWAIDLPGHGKSPRADNPEKVYTVEALAQIIAQFVDKRISEPVVLVGTSLGGNLAIEVSANTRNAAGLVICGSAPVSSPEEIPYGFMPNPAIGYAFQEELDDEKQNALCQLFVGERTEFYDAIKNDLANTDKNFRSSLGASAAKGEFADEKKILRELKIPVGVFHGGGEQLANIDYIKSIEINNLWRGEIQIIKDAPHLAHVTHASEFNKLLTEFITEECI